MDIPKQHERLMELIGHLRDGGLSEQQAAELESLLANDADAMAYYIESTDIITMLHRQQGTSAIEQDSLTAAPVAPVIDTAIDTAMAPTGFSSAMLWCGAVIASLVIGILVGRAVLPQDKTASQVPVDSVLASLESDPEIATLSSATGCVWRSDDESLFEGQRLTARSLHLTDGVAVVHFDSDVRLLIEGPVHLDLLGLDRAMLHRGKAVFRGEDNLDHFTLATPFSRILDEGTEYAVSVDPRGIVGEIHVFDGRVDCQPTNMNANGEQASTVQLAAGEARRFKAPNRIESITLDSSQFVRKPPIRNVNSDSITTAESFAYETPSLIGREGGFGWRGPWRQPKEFDSKQGALLRPSDSLKWNSKSPAGSSDGALTLGSDSGLHRTLKHPIHMDRDGVHYLSFLIRKGEIEELEKRNGWAYLTLRDPRQEAKKLAIGWMGSRGRMRVVHDGRATNTTNRLEDDVVYLFVCKILSRKNKDDQVFIRVYEDQDEVDSVEPSAWSVTPRPANDDSVFSELRLYSKDCNPIQLDNIRIGKTWSSVTFPYIE